MTEYWMKTDEVAWIGEEHKKQWPLMLEEG